MVFWKTYPLSTFWRTIWNTQRFQDLKLEKEPIPSPTKNDAKMVSNNDRPTLCRIQTFLQQYFGDPPKTPVLDIPEDSIVPTSDLLFYVEDHDTIVGCIRYHFLGEFVTDKKQPMYVVDCFCIHPSWRKKGVGDYLLTTLHRYANQHDIPYCLFLKEGWSLSILHSPLYSSRYVYQAVRATTPSPCIRSLTSKQAHRLLRIFHELNPNVFIVFPEHRMTNQYWRLYRKDGTWILACVQSAYQWFMEKGSKRRMGWVTCWLESPGTSQTDRAEASQQLVHSMVGVFDYIWSNEEWIGSSSEWTNDGPFHWYAYQWATSIHLKGGYCIIH
jgi:GNAT superfamily N-acetyltransferase